MSFQPIAIFEKSSPYAVDKEYVHSEVTFETFSDAPPNLVGKVTRLSRHSFRYYIKGRKRFSYRGKATTVDQAVQRCIAAVQKLSYNAK